MLRGTARKTTNATIRGSAAYAPGQTARIQAADITPFGGKQTFIALLELDLDLLMTHDAGAPVALPEELAYRAIESIVWRVPGGHVFIDVGSQAGCFFYVMNWLLTGRKPHSQGGGGNISLTNGTNTAVRVKLPLFVGYQPQGIKPDDYNIALEDVLNSAIEVKWANGAAGGVFDSGSNNERIVSGTLRATWHLVGREEEYRVAPYLSYVQYHAGRRRAPAARGAGDPSARGAAESRGRDHRRPRDRRGARPGDPDRGRRGDRGRDRRQGPERALELLPRRLARRRAAPPRDRREPVRRVPLPRQRPYMLTHLVGPGRDPQLKITGTRTTPLIGWLCSALRDKDSTVQITERAARKGALVPPDFSQRPERYLDPKAAGKGFAYPGPEVSQRLPWKVELRPSTKD